MLRADKAQLEATLNQSGAAQGTQCSHCVPWWIWFHSSYYKRSLIRGCFRGHRLPLGFWRRTPGVFTLQCQPSVRRAQWKMSVCVLWRLNTKKGGREILFGKESRADVFYVMVAQIQVEFHTLDIFTARLLKRFTMLIFLSALNYLQLINDLVLLFEMKEQAFCVRPRWWWVFFFFNVCISWNSFGSILALWTKYHFLQSSSSFLAVLYCPWPDNLTRIASKWMLQCLWRMLCTCMHAFQSTSKLHLFEIRSTFYLWLSLSFVCHRAKWRAFITEALCCLCTQLAQCTLLVSTCLCVWAGFLFF